MKQQDEPNSKLARSLDNFRWLLEGGVLDFNSSDRMNGVCATNRIRRGFRQTDMFDFPLPEGYTFSGWSATVDERFRT